jgi:ankyrin repeat protein
MMGRRGSFSPSDDLAGALKVLEQPDNLAAFKELLLGLASNSRLATTLAASDPHTGWTLFHAACNAGKLREAYCLLEAGADVHAETLDGSTGLRFLAKLKKDQAVPVAVYNQLLHVCVSRGAKLTQATKNGLETPLHAACLAGNLICVSFLLSARVDLDCVTNNGFAALHFAIFGRNAEIVRDLLAAGADPGLYCKKYKSFDEKKAKLCHF